MTAGRFRWDDFVLDTDSYRLERHGTPVALEPKAFDLLTLMIGRPGHLFTKQEIFDAVWPATAVSDHALTRIVAQIRRALGDEAREPRYLETVPTRGYRWIRPVEADAPAVTAPDAAVPGERTGATAGVARRRRAVLASVLLLACVGTGLVAWLARSSADTRATWAAANVLPNFPLQITTHGGLDLHPALSPGGDAVAFASDRSGRFEIHVRTFGSGGSELAVTSDGGQNVQPAWSPDGRYIAYHSAVHGGVWVMPARGGTARQLVRQGSAPRWSPDGQLVVFQSDEHADIAPTGFGAQIGSTIQIVDAAGGDPRPLTLSGTPSGAHGTPSWSRDGRYVAFSVFDGGDDDGLWIVRVDTRVVTRAGDRIRGYEAVFADNDTSLYVAGGAPVIYRIPFDPVSGTSHGTAEPLIVPGVAAVRGLSTIDDGRTLAFAGLTLDSHIWSQAIDEDGTPVGTARALTRDTSRRSSGPSISPDGRRVAYMAARRGEAPNIWIRNADGTGQALELTDGTGVERAPLWSGDSRRIAYIGERDDDPGAEVRAVDVATRRDDLILRIDAESEIAPGSDSLAGRLAELRLSRTFDLAAFAMTVPPYGHRRVYMAGLAPFAPRALTDGVRSVGYPAWSPDERRLAVQIQELGATQLGIVDIASGELRQVTSERAQIWARSWSPDGSRVAAAVLRDRLWSLEWFDVVSGRRGIMTPPAAANVYYRYPDWSPLGDVVVFERGEMRGNIWTMTLPRR